MASRRAKHCVRPFPSPTQPCTQTVDLVREAPFTWRLLSGALFGVFRSLKHGKTSSEADFWSLDIRKIMAARGTNSPPGWAEASLLPSHRRRPSSKGRCKSGKIRRQTRTSMTFARYITTPSVSSPSAANVQAVTGVGLRARASSCPAVISESIHEHQQASFTESSVP